MVTYVLKRCLSGWFLSVKVVQFPSHNSYLSILTLENKLIWNVLYVKSDPP
jgi:hypothetical protein